jgi:bifunctional DNA-binding transcriptional regulator/antitoxin component of YhaV-PrlF toxin-antitoxin module
MALTVTSKGQLTLRKDLLAHLGARAGSKLAVEKLPDGRLELRAVEADAPISRAFGLLAGRGVPPLTMDELRKAAESGWAGEA